MTTLRILGPLLPQGLPQPALHDMQLAVCGNGRGAGRGGGNNGAVARKHKQRDPLCGHSN